MASRAPRLKVALLRRRPQVPLSDAAAPARERLATERRQLDAIAPQALDLAAEVLARLHGGLCGRMTALRADRAERYRRGQLIGEHTLPIEDFAYLVLEGGEAGLDALDILEAAVGRTTSPLDDAESSGTVARENASLAEAFAEFEATLARAIEDDDLTPGERATLAKAVAHIEEHLPHLKAAIRGHHES